MRLELSHRFQATSCAPPHILLLYLTVYLEPTKRITYSITFPEPYG